MNERIFVTAGGSGHRLEAATDRPKALLELPNGELVIQRQLRMLPDEFDVTICTGFREELFSKLLFKPGEFFMPSFITTYKPPFPCGVLVCIQDVMNFYDLDSYTFLLGDTVWSQKAMDEALSLRHEALITMYGGQPGPGETYMMTISSEGIALMRDLLTQEPFKTDPPLEPWPEFVVRGGTIWLLDRWMNQVKSFDWNIYKTRQVRTAPVDDFDTDKQYEKVWKRFSEGEFNE